MRHRPGGGVKRTPRILPLLKGTVVKAPIVPTKGIVKRRPAVVLVNPTGNAGELILVAGVTSDNREYNPADTQRYPPDQYIYMPNAEDGTPDDCFPIRCAVNAEWVQRFTRDQLEILEGRLSDQQVDDLIVKLKAFILHHPD